MSAIAFIHISLEIWGSVFCLIAALSVYLGRRKGNRADRMIVFMELTVTTLMIMDALAWGFRGYPGELGAVMVRMSNLAVYLISYGILAEFTTYQLYVINGKTDFPVRLWSYAIYAISAVGAVMVEVSQFTDFFYYFDNNNFYHRTNNFYISQVIAIVGMVLAVYMMIYHRKCFSNEMFVALLSYMALPLLALLVQLFVYGISILNIAIAISMLMIFFSWQMDRSRESVQMAEQILEQERKMNRQQQEIMMSQIQPHFLFNSLTAIAQLCEKNPKMARHATISFAEFLRANMNVLKNPEPILFSQELENIENYLVLEQIRFGDRLHIEYDIEEEDFEIPILTVQPLVENAIKHGIKQSGTVWISTRELEDAYEVVVQDNGVGYDGHSVPEDGKTHIGVENIRNRLADVVHATLTYENPPEGGTIARIRIPKEQSAEMHF